MWEEKRIGVIREVTGSGLVVIIDPEITNLTKKIGAKTYYVGQIGTYVLVPLGNVLILGIVSEFKKADVYEGGAIVQR